MRVSDRESEGKSGGGGVKCYNGDGKSKEEWGTIFAWK